MRVATCILALTVGLTPAAAPASAQLAETATGFVYAWLPVTPDQAREVTALLGSPGVVVVDLVDATNVVLDAIPSMPGALLHDVLNAPSRHLQMIHGLITDVIDLAARPKGTGLFGNTLRALHRSALFTAAAGVARRVTEPTNRTVRLAIVLAARTQGLPVEARDLEAVRRAIDADSPDLGPLVARVLERLVQLYGRDGVRLLLTR
jgi:hypothetical protein